MTDIIDTGDLARFERRRSIDRATLGRVYPAALPPPDMTARLPLADLTEKIELSHHALGLSLIIDNRPASPDTHGPSPLYRPRSLADTVFGLDKGGYPAPDPVPPPPPPTPTSGETRPTPPFPTPPPPPPPAWALSAAEYPTVSAGDYLRQPQHRAPDPAWLRWPIAVGALLAVSAALTVGALAVWFR
jgi:hypothetical protein